MANITIPFLNKTQNQNPSNPRFSPTPFFTAESDELRSRVAHIMEEIVCRRVCVEELQNRELSIVGTLKIQKHQQNKETSGEYTARANILVLVRSSNLSNIIPG
jgi:hypothetical protein